MGSIPAPRTSKTHIDVVLKGSFKSLSFHVSWNVVHSSYDTSTFKTADIVLKATSQWPNTSSHKLSAEDVHQVYGVNGLTRSPIPLSSAALQILAEALAASQNGSPSHLQLVYPTADGFIARADFMERRFSTCLAVEKAVGFVSPRLRMKRRDMTSARLSDLFFHAAGALLLKRDGAVSSKAPSFDKSRAELHARLSFPWVVPQPIKQYRAVYVHATKIHLPDEPFIESAAALGLDLVVLGQEGEFFSLPENRHLCEEFIRIDVTDDSSLPSRIYDAVKGYGKHVDGIFSFNDAMQVPIAKAAEMLSLPTAPSSAYELCADKFATRKLMSSESDNIQSVYFAGYDVLLARLDEGDGSVGVRYPVIVKPSKGMGSQGVYKCKTREELLVAARTAMDMADQRRDAGIVVETFVDGPEFDANVVLCDGEMLFCEILDDYPCAGDGEDESGVEADFIETDIMTPTALPPSEIELVKQFCHEAVLKAGFRWGVFHIEGRVDNSSMHFTTEDGIMDLRRRNGPAPGKPRCFLIEINSRAAGIAESYMTVRTYGVDYFASQMLMALRDKQRLTALSQPYSFSLGGGQRAGHQYHSETLILHPNLGGQGGTCRTHDACADMVARAPDLNGKIAYMSCYFKYGDPVPAPKPGVVFHVGFVVVYSRESREETQRAANRVREVFRIEIE